MQATFSHSLESLTRGEDSHGDHNKNVAYRVICPLVGGTFSLRDATTMAIVQPFFASLMLLVGPRHTADITHTPFPMMVQSFCFLSNMRS
jgi:hypothetical protein